MRRFVRSLALLFAAACAVTPLAAATQRVEVRILAPAAKPLAGVLVKIVAVDGDPFSAQASSDSGGTAEFVLPSAKRSYRLEIDHEDYAPFTETFDLSARRLQRGESVRLEVEMPPLTAAHLYNRGVRALQAENLLAAEAALQRAVELEPSFLEGWRVLSLIYLETASTEWIVRLKEQGVLASETNVQVTSAEALKRALNAADRAIAIDSGDVQALRSRYDALAGLQRVDEADAALTALAAKDTSRELSRLLFNAGAATANAGQPERARLRLNEALARDPSLWQAHSALAELAVRAQDLEGALAELDRALAVAPRQVRVWERKVEVLRALGRADEAAAAEARLAELRAAG